MSASREDYTLRMEKGCVRISINGSEDRVATVSTPLAIINFAADHSSGLNEQMAFLLLPLVHALQIVDADDNFRLQIVTTMLEGALEEYSKPHNE